MSRLVLTLHTVRPARCPWCQTDLSPQGCTLLDGFLVCVDCAQLRSLFRVEHLEACRHHDPSGRCWSVRRGVNIYTPPEWYPRSHSAVVADDGAVSALLSGPNRGISR